MNWETIGALGEMIGAVAVVVTLLYLSARIRQNTRSNQTAAIQMMSAQNAEWLSLLSQPGGAAKLFYLDSSRGLQDMNDDDSSRYVSLIIHMCRLYDTQYHLYKMDAIPEELWASSKVSLSRTMESKASKQAWRLTKDLFTDSFARLVQDMIDADKLEEAELSPAPRLESIRRKG